MALHLIKLCVGAETIADLAQWQTRRFPDQGAPCWHDTYQTPKRSAELLDGGSLYWVIRGEVLVRQALKGFEAGIKEDGSSCCRIMLDRRLVPVSCVSRRPFQGWRYLAASDAPADLAVGSPARDLAPDMRRALAELRLL